MSFLRPGAAGAIRRWGETAVAAAVAALALWLGVAWARQGALVGWAMLAGAALVLFWMRAALLGALARGRADGPGVVVLREGEIGYFAPWAGGVLDLDRLERVEVYRAASSQAPVWRLQDSDGTALVIPGDAEGAAHLPEALAALPGFSDLTAIDVLRRARAGQHLIWERESRRLSRP